MNIIISGYGRMGKEVEKICIKRNHKIIAIIDNESQWDKLSVKGQTNSIIIDFSLPDKVIGNIQKAFDLGIPIVTGTTGWHNQLDYIEEICQHKDGTLFYAPNFSIGVNIFFRANIHLAKLMSRIDGYSCSINETHHIHKIDAPSGTAIATAQGIIDSSSILNNWCLNKDENEESLPIYAYREGEVTGTHVVNYDSEVDSITLTHTAKNRQGFALGAVLAAEFVISKKGVYNMDDLINEIS